MSNIDINNKDEEFSDTITNDLDIDSTNPSVKDILKNVDVEEEMDKDVLLRQSKLLYPEVEEWILKIAVEGYINTIKREKSKGEESI